MGFIVTTSSIDKYSTAPEFKIISYVWYAAHKSEYFFLH